MELETQCFAVAVVDGSVQVLLPFIADDVKRRNPHVTVGIEYAVDALSNDQFILMQLYQCLLGSQLIISTPEWYSGASEMLFYCLNDDARLRKFRDLLGESKGCKRAL